MTSANCDGIGEPPQRLDVELEGAGPRHRRLRQHAGRDLDVLRLQRGDDLAGREVARGGLVRIEPDAHGVVVVAEHLDVADALEAAQRVADVQRGVVRHVELVARAVWRQQVDDHEKVGRGLLHGDTEALHHVGQPRRGDRDAVLGQHLRGVEVGAQPEGHRQQQVAVAGRLARKVEHVLDAVDLLFERRGHGVGDDLGGRAGIARRDLDRRRRDLRVLRDGQGDVGHRADDGDEEAHHHGEDRPLDEEVRQTHGVPFRVRVSPGRAPERWCRAAA